MRTTLKKGTILSTAFEEYTIEEQIGQGGNGTVFLVVSTNNEPFAIKVINKSGTNKDKIKRFKNEINFCQKYDHPNIIKVLDYGTYKNGSLNCLFYVMPYYNSTLRNEIVKGLDSEKIIPIYYQLLTGIEFAHKKGVWHRDIKPENILYDTNQQLAIIADFGIAHFCVDDIATAVATKMGDRLANYIYAAPEQRISGHKVDGRADVFALGLILNEMFTNTVISGSKFKRITDCCKEYEFLDQVVEELISQDSMLRLYPVRKIFIEIFALIKLESNKTELKKIAERKINETTEEDPLFTPPTVINKKYINNKLAFYLDKETNSLWDNILVAGQFEHSSLLSYPPSSFSPKYDNVSNCTVFFVNIRPNENQIELIVNNFNSWLPSVSSLYTKNVKQTRANLIEQEIQEREYEIKAKESEMKINDKLKSLI